MSAHPLGTRFFATLAACELVVAGRATAVAAGTVVVALPGTLEGEVATRVASAPAGTLLEGRTLNEARALAIANRPAARPAYRVPTVLVAGAGRDAAGVDVSARVAAHFETLVVGQEMTRVRQRLGMSALAEHPGTSAPGPSAHR